MICSFSVYFDAFPFSLQFLTARDSQARFIVAPTKYDVNVIRGSGHDFVYREADSVPYRFAELSRGNCYQNYMKFTEFLCTNGFPKNRTGLTCPSPEINSSMLQACRYWSLRAIRLLQQQQRGLPNLDRRALKYYPTRSCFSRKDNDTRWLAAMGQENRVRMPSSPHHLLWNALGMED